MKAITIHQPRASLLAHSVQTIETRSWHPPRSIIGTRIAIHAGKFMPPRSWVYGPLQDAIEDLYGPNWRSTAPFGAVVAIARLASTREVIGHDLSYAYLSPQSQTVDDHRDQVPVALYGNFSHGRWLWFLEDVEVMKPVAARGRQGFWDWTPL